MYPCRALHYSSKMLVDSLPVGESDSLDEIVELSVVFLQAEIFFT